jgi:hypothetical protein
MLCFEMSGCGLQKEIQQSCNTCNFKNDAYGCLNFQQKHNYHSISK